MNMIGKLQTEVNSLYDRRQALMDQIEQVDSELRECETALRVVQRFEEAPDHKSAFTAVPKDSVPHTKDTQHVSETPKSGDFLTKKDVALKILQDSYPRGLKSDAIRRIARRRYERDIAQTYLGVALSRFKKKGEVKIAGHVWYYVPPEKRQNETEAPVVAGASEADDSGVAG